MKQLYKATWEEILERKTRPEGDCLIWTAGCHSQGYPMVRYKNRMVKVDRTQIEKKYDITLTRNERVKNTCGNIKCVNVEHYELLERDDPKWNCVEHGFSEEKKRDIKAIYDAYSHPKTGTKYGSHDAIRRKYPGTSRTTILKIRRELS